MSGISETFKTARSSLIETVSAIFQRENPSTSYSTRGFRKLQEVKQFCAQIRLKQLFMSHPSSEDVEDVDTEAMEKSPNDDYSCSAWESMMQDIEMKETLMKEEAAADREAKGPDFVPSDYSDYDSESEDDGDLFECLKPCSPCSEGRCSNCFKPFSAKERPTNKIPSFYHQLHNEDTVNIEEALICVFDPTGPYMTWVRRMGDKREIKRREKKVFKKEDDKDDSGVGEAVANGQNGSGSLPFADPNENKSGSCSSTSPQLSESESLPENVPPAEEQEEKGKKPETFQDDASSSSEFEDSTNGRGDKFTTVMITEMIDAYEKLLKNFYLCHGCAELLTVLYHVWELLEAKKLPARLYFHTVMMGFSHATKAQEVVYSPHPESKYRIENVYSHACHPKGCRTKTTMCGDRIKLETDEDLLRKAVGCLHAFMHGAFCRVYNEKLKDVMCLMENEIEAIWGF